MLNNPIELANMSWFEKFSKWVRAFFPDWFGEWIFPCQSQVREGGRGQRGREGGFGCLDSNYLALLTLFCTLSLITLDARTFSSWYVKLKCRLIPKDTLAQNMTTFSPSPMTRMIGLDQPLISSLALIWPMMMAASCTTVTGLYYNVVDYYLRDLYSHLSCCLHTDSFSNSI